VICEIQWIDVKTGRPTPDENEAVAMVRVKGHVENFRFGDVAGSAHYVPTSRWYPICSEHLKRLNDAGMHWWEKESLEVTPE
jgi:hypothetical protein